MIRNNRARGSLFSTPKKTVVENNIFDHTSGTAILLCGDCNGWFETGACHDVLIRNNKFINALTNQFQFTNAVISIYPEIPDLKGQKKYFHGGIVIEDNEFETFDMPILYAKSVDGLVFRNNVIRQNHDYPAAAPRISTVLSENGCLKSWKGQRRQTMSYNSWHIYGYGLCVSDIEGLSTEKIQALLATMSLTLKGRGKNALLKGSYPSYNEGVIGLTGHCLSFYARTGKL